MNPFDYPMLQRIVKRAIDEIALLRYSNKAKYDKRFINNWITEFRSLEQTEVHTLINNIFLNQCTSIQEACTNNVEYVHIPVLGHLRLNKTHQDILISVSNNGSITNEEVQEIINNHIERKNALKQDQILNVPINIKANEKTSER